MNTECMDMCIEMCEEQLDVTASLKVFYQFTSISINFDLNRKRRTASIISSLDSFSEKCSNGGKAKGSYLGRIRICSQERYETSLLGIT